MKLNILTRALAAAGALLAGLGFSADSAAQSQRALDARVKEVIDHWTPERRAGAIPRHLVIDERGLGYLRGADGGLEPYGHDIAAQAAPGGGGDTTGPSVGLTSPADHATINSTSVTFTASVSDLSGVKSATLGVRKGTGTVQSFAMTPTGGVYSVSLINFTDGDWTWNVTAKDNAKPVSNTTVSGTRLFTIKTGSTEPPPTTDTVTNAQMTSDGKVRYAVGRIYFEMPANPRKTKWNGYVCSGTVVDDTGGNAGRSIILTASHCVYDDVNKAFARKVMFIPDQAHTTGTRTDTDCTNDPRGCWVPKLGVVEKNWTTLSFPDNVHWDYAFYVVNDSGAHLGTAASSDVLDVAVPPMTISFDPVVTDVLLPESLSHAIGYSYSDDPKLMYCAERMKDLDGDNYWLSQCDLSGGSSGGPWSQPFDMTAGNGVIISVNSWGYTNQPGMAGPKLHSTSAACVFATAKTTSTAPTFTDGNAGAIADCGF